MKREGETPDREAMVRVLTAGGLTSAPMMTQMEQKHGAVSLPLPLSSFGDSMQLIKPCLAFKPSLQITNENEEAHRLRATSTRHDSYPLLLQRQVCSPSSRRAVTSTKRASP